jgi:hypothetical protein
MRPNDDCPKCYGTGRVTVEHIDSWPRQEECECVRMPLAWTKAPPTEGGTYFWGRWAANGTGLSWDGTYRWESDLVGVIQYGDGEPFVFGDPTTVKRGTYLDEDDYVIRVSDYGGYWWPEPVKFPPDPLEKYGHYSEVDEDDILLTQEEDRSSAD